MKARARRSMPGDEAWAGEGWSISVSRAERLVRFEVTDYHAGPFVLSRRELADLAKAAAGRLGRFRRRSARPGPR
jgi:hypothetical protein